MFCSPDAMLSTWKPGWQSPQTVNLFDWARRYVKPGQVIWDIGANQGLFSFAALAMSAPSGHVVAFEPDPFLAGLLHRTRTAQAAESRIDVLPIAVAGDAALATFSVASKDRALNHLTAFAGNPRTEGERDRLTVVTVTLEWLADQLPAPDLIKIDVEGGETDVLGGAERKASPSCSPYVDHRSCCGELVVDSCDSAQRSLSIVRCKFPEREVLSPAWNTLAVPTERL